jgi:hypothetical protein
VVVAFKAPAYSDSQKDKAALDLLLPIAFGKIRICISGSCSKSRRWTRSRRVSTIS